MEHADLMILLGGSWDGTYLTIYSDNEKDLEWLYATVKSSSISRIMVPPDDTNPRQLRIKPTGPTRRRMGGWLDGKMLDPPLDFRATPTVLNGLFKFNTSSRQEMQFPALDEDGARIILQELIVALGAPIQMLSPRVFLLSETAYQRMEVVSLWN